MKSLWLALLLCLTSPAQAEPVRVTSGEHDGFTRLVFDFGLPVDWQVGRTADGYQLRLVNKTATYDLTAAFDLIGKSRLAAVWAAPGSGHLQIGLACACHAIPFEFRPGVIVIDLKDGPPPKGSSFETALDGSATLPLQAQAAVRPRPRPGSHNVAAVPPDGVVGSYDWKEVARTSLGRDVRPSHPPAPKPAVDNTLLLPDPGLQPLRDQILHEMSRGVAQGVVEIPRFDGKIVDLPETTFPLAQIRIGEAPTSVSRPQGSIQGELGAQGASCIAPSALDFAGWGDEALPLADQMASLRSGLAGEFDHPDPEAVARAVKFLLFLGFGAEARQMIDAFDLQKNDGAVMNALSYLVDDEPDHGGLFHGQAACKGPAALWAFLADDTLSKGDQIATGSIRLAFAALPLHLRQLIGPRLARKFLAIGDEETVRALTDAIARAPGGKGARVDLIEAELERHIGNPAGAEKIAAEVLADPGPDQPEALIALTEARVAQGLPMTHEVVLALQAHLADHAGSKLESQLQEALILAEAASGNFAAAFASLETSPARQDDVWAMLATLAPDDVFLSFAVLGSSTTEPNTPDETATSIARRLAELGLGSAAERWLSSVEAPDPLLVAEAALRRSDARAALLPLVGSKSEEGQAMRLQALGLLGENLLQAELLAEVGNLPAASAAFARSGDWQWLAATGEEPWRSLAARLPETPPLMASATDLPYGPLARGHDLAAAAAETRAAIEMLLATVEVPSEAAASASADKPALP